jgi:hypothetical protein
MSDVATPPASAPMSRDRLPNRREHTVINFTTADGFTRNGNGVASGPLGMLLDLLVSEPTP